MVGSPGTSCECVGLISQCEDNEIAPTQQHRQDGRGHQYLQYACVQIVPYILRAWTEAVLHFASKGYLNAFILRPWMKHETEPLAFGIGIKFWSPPCNQGIIMKKTLGAAGGVGWGGVGGGGTYWPWVLPWNKLALSPDNSLEIRCYRSQA